MKLILILLLSILFQTYAIAQETAHDLFLVSFKDKGNLKANVADPSQFLSSRAIERRRNHKIPFDQSDLPVNEQYVNKIAGNGARILCRSRWFNYVIVEATQKDLASFRSLPFVGRTTELNKQVRTQDNFEASNSFVRNQVAGSARTTELKTSNANVYDYGAAATQINQIKGEFLHNHGFCGQGMTIAVIDAGFGDADIMPVFDSLRANNQIKGTYNFAQPGASVYDAGTSLHGTEVLSTMGANLPGNMVGTAPKADYWLLRSEVAQSESLIEEYYWVSAAEYADSVGADVINSSLGYTTFDDPQTNHTYEDMDGNTTYVTLGADKAAEKGILVVNSAGNSGSDIWKYIGAPADGDSVFSIGAVDGSGAYAFFSSVGPTFDGRIKPTVSAMGYFTAVYTPFGLTYGSGTSFSSPIIAGMSACLWQAAPSLSNMQIIEAIKVTADQASAPDTLLGWGIPDYSSAYNVLGTSSNEEVLNIPEIKIYPNPYSQYFVADLNCKVKGILSLEIYDLAGRMILKDRVNLAVPSDQLLVSNFNMLPGGFYLLKINTPSKVFSARVTKL